MHYVVLLWCIRRPRANWCSPYSLCIWNTGRVTALLRKAGKEATSEWLEMTVLHQAAPFRPVLALLFLFEWTHGGAFLCQGKSHCKQFSLFRFLPDEDVSFCSFCGFGLYCPFLETTVNASCLLKKAWRFISWSKKLPWLSFRCCVWEHLLLLSNCTLFLWPHGTWSYSLDMSTKSSWCEQFSGELKAIQYISLPTKQRVYKCRFLKSRQCWSCWNP